MNVNWTVWLVWSVGWVGAQLVDMYESKGGESEFSSSYTILDLVCALVAISPQNTPRSSRLKKKKSAREQQLNGLCIDTLMMVVALKTNCTFTRKRT